MGTVSKLIAFVFYFVLIMAIVNFALFIVSRSWPNLIASLFGFGVLGGALYYYKKL